MSSILMRLHNSRQQCERSHSQTGLSRGSREPAALVLALAPALVLAPTRCQPRGSALLWGMQGMCRMMQAQDGSGQMGNLV